MNKAHLLVFLQNSLQSCDNPSFFIHIFLFCRGSSSGVPRKGATWLKPTSSVRNWALAGLQWASPAQPENSANKAECLSLDALTQSLHRLCASVCSSQLQLAISTFPYSWDLDVHGALKVSSKGHVSKYERKDNCATCLMNSPCSYSIQLFVA